MTLQPLRLFGLLLSALSLVATTSIPTEPPPVFLAKWGTTGTDESEFDKPRGLAVDANGDVYVADNINNRIQKFDSNGTFLRMWGWGVDTGAATFEICTGSCQVGVLGSGDGQLSRPWGVAVDASGDVYVGDTKNQRVQKFDRDGNFLTKWGTLGTSGTRFQDPGGVAVDASGNVYVTDTLNHRITKFSNLGTFIRTWGWGVMDGTAELQTCAFAVLCKAGIAGSGNGQLDIPAAIAIDASGNVYVADYNNERMQKFDGNGTFLAQWGSPGYGEGQFVSPTVLAVGASGNVYAGGGASPRIQIFDGNGTYLTEFGTSGIADGRFGSPQGAAVSPRGEIYVGDDTLNRIQKFGGPWLQVFVGEP